MFEYLKFNNKRIYPTLVVSTMSSGKSTLINALVGTELLPSMNRACTAKAVAILDNDWKPNFEIHAVDSNGNYSHIEEATKEVISNYNRTNDVLEMIVEGEIKGIKNSKKSLLLIDTPGINNCLDMSHEKATLKVLDEYSEGMVLYVINAQQIGTYDDSNFLSLIVNKIKNNDKFNILFVVNKMDLIDPEKENPVELMNNCRKYIQSKGIENPTVIPVSASNALIFKKVLDGVELSELEEVFFSSSYRIFKNDAFSLQDYMQIPYWGDLDEIVYVSGQKYKRSEILAALENTGIPQLEKTIDEMFVRALKIKTPRITMNKEKEIKNKKNASKLKKKGKIKQNRK